MVCSDDRVIDRLQQPHCRSQLHATPAIISVIRGPIQHAQKISQPRGIASRSLARGWRHAFSIHADAHSAASPAFVELRFRRLDDVAAGVAASGRDFGQNAGPFLVISTATVRIRLRVEAPLIITFRKKGKKRPHAADRYCWPHNTSPTFCLEAHRDALASPQIPAAPRLRPPSCSSSRASRCPSRSCPPAPAARRRASCRTKSLVKKKKKQGARLLQPSRPSSMVCPPNRAVAAL